MNIINIINFVRACEPRHAVDLTEPVRQQLALLEQYGLKGTFLLQYDTLLDDGLMDLIVECKARSHEIGGWLEIVGPQCEAAGIPWRGRWAWDWHANVGFTVGYMPAEREKLIDAFMALFREKLGYYPLSVGSWLIDAHSLKYMADRYGIAASCNCKEQWGTDGYTLWGGYYGQGYYPNVNNAFAPANSAENQINVPVFKMLGSDPIYQYDLGLDVGGTGAAKSQFVVTLEPVYTGQTGGGGVPEWVDWYLRENYSGHDISFSYAQAGQENSFGWSAMRNGLVYQHKAISEMIRAGKLTDMTLAETGAWYKERYAQSPPCAIAALSDWKDENHKSVWYCCKRYRANLFYEDGKVWLRDVHLYRDDYHERYMNAVTENEILVYDNPPLMDGNRWSGGGIRAGMYLMDDKGACRGDLSIRETEDSLIAELKCANGTITLTFSPDGIAIDGYDGVYLSLHYKPGCELDGAASSADALTLSHAGFSYAVTVENGVLEKGDEMTLRPAGRGAVKLIL